MNRLHSFVVAISALCLMLRPVRAPAQDAPLPPEQAAATLTLPDGFQATLFAGEPEVVQPISMTTDARGRLWVVECLSYPQWTTDGSGHDRVVIFEDTDGDGRHDSRKVFLDNGRNLSGIELGFGGVWLCSTPELVFVPDRNLDDVPDGPAEVLLDGWDVTAKHNVFNGLTWGPDGWLYGMNGILSNSLVGAPGTPEAERTRLNCGVWRYHPTRREFELYASGTTNPWGLDFDAKGRMFITNCVIEHVFQVFPGGHYKRMFGQDLNPNVYGLIESCADHIHWGGGFWDISIGGVHNDFGGGHAHAGAMVYLGDNWPDEYRGNLYTVNIHGQRMNRDSMHEEGSGVVASHLPDFCLSHDPWFRGLEMIYGPDGGVYLSDWNDVGECHDYEDVERDTGRIFKITYGTPEHRPVDLRSLTDVELVELQTHENEWFARMSRLVLQERAAQREIEGAALERLEHLSRSDQENQLRCVWAQHVLNAGTPAGWLNTSGDVLNWGVRFAAEDHDLSMRFRRGFPSEREQLQTLAGFGDPLDGMVELAAALQRVSLDDRFEIARALLRHEDYADDHNLPLMIWYGIEPLAGDEQGRDLELLGRARIPLVQRYLARRIASLDGGIDRLSQWLAGQNDERPERLEHILLGLRDAVEGRRDLEKPKGWTDIEARSNELTPAGRDSLQYLSLVFGDEQAYVSLTSVADNRNAPAEDRLRAVETLIQVPDERLVPLLVNLLNEPQLAGPALRGLSAYDDPLIASSIVERYAGFDFDRKQEAISTLAARKDTTTVLLDSIQAGTIPAKDVSIYVARQIRDYNDETFNQRVEQLWGSVRATPEEKSRKISQYLAELNTAAEPGDPSAGRALFVQTCAKCHKLFGEGASIGPEITGAQRQNAEYLVQHIVDPSAAVPAEYRVYTVLTADGRLLNGVLPEETDRTLTLQTPTERLVIDRSDIDELKPTSQSMMPEGQLDQLTPRQRRDLFAYLQAAAQPPLPGDAGAGR